MNRPGNRGGFFIGIFELTLRSLSKMRTGKMGIWERRGGPEWPPYVECTNPNQIRRDNICV